MNNINEYQQTAMDYKRRISGSFMLVEPARIQSKLSGNDFCVTRKIDGIMECVFWKDGKAFMAGSGGTILADLPCLKEFAKCVQAAWLDSVTIAAELYYPLAEGRPPVMMFCGRLPFRRRGSSSNLLRSIFWNAMASRINPLITKRPIMSCANSFPEK